MARTGRRPGDSGTRDAILEAARSRFAEMGYRGASIRTIAGEAQVDPALVHHYFGTKRELFAEVLQFPVRPDLVVAQLAGAPPDELGEVLVRTFLRVWDEPAARDRLRLLLTTAVSDPTAARMLREFLVETVLAPVLTRLGVDAVGWRASLVASQLVGLGLTRFVLGMEPLSTAAPDAVVVVVGPTIQRYLTGPLDVTEVGDERGGGTRPRRR